MGLKQAHESLKTIIDWVSAEKKVYLTDGTVTRGVIRIDVWDGNSLLLKLDNGRRFWISEEDFLDNAVDVMGLQEFDGALYIAPIWWINI